MLRTMAGKLALYTRFTLILSGLIYIPLLLWKQVVVAGPGGSVYIDPFAILFFPFTIVLGPARLGMWWLYGVWVVGPLMVAIAEQIAKGDRGK